MSDLEVNYVERDSVHFERCGRDTCGLQQLGMESFAHKSTRISEFE